VERAEKEQADEAASREEKINIIWYGIQCPPVFVLISLHASYTVDPYLIHLHCTALRSLVS
jgi:hypothetical protein